MSQIPWVVLITIVILGLIAIAVVMKKKQPHKVDYYTLFIMGIVWMGAGVPLKMYSLSAVGFVFMLAGAVNRDKWEENRRPWSKLSASEKNLKLRLILLLGIALLLLIGVLWFEQTR